MERSTKAAWLAPEAGDLREDVVDDVPVPGQSVKIKALSATQANAATSEAIITFEERGQQRMKVDNVALDILRFQAGVIEPQFEMGEVRTISAKFGPAFNRVVSEIVKLSGIDRGTVAETEARFPGDGVSKAKENGSDPADGDDRPDKPVRAGDKARADR